MTSPREVSYPFEGVPATESRWQRMARVFAAPCVIGTPANNALGLTFAGLNITIGRGTLGSAEAWVRHSFFVLDQADWTLAVPPNAHATQSRVDRIVLRFDPSQLLVANRVKIVRVEGTPAASPVAVALQQTDGGVWELPLWRFTVPPASASPIGGLIDDRKFYDPDVGGGDVLFLRKSSKAAFASGPDTELTFANVPTGVYMLDGVLLISVSSSGAGISAQLVNGPTGGRATLSQAGTRFGTSSPTVSATSNTSVYANWQTYATNVVLGYGYAINGANANTDTYQPFYIGGLVTVTASGSFSVEALGNSNVFLNSGSWLRLSRVG